MNNSNPTIRLEALKLALQYNKGVEEPLVTARRYEEYLAGAEEAKSKTGKGVKASG